MAAESLTSSQSSEYQIGPENALQIDVYYGKNENISQKVRVSSAGAINYPLVGEVQVVGLTVAQLQEKLRELLEKDYLVNPQVTVFIEEYSTVSIMGEVKKPGVYPIKGRLTVVELISLAEGFSKIASPNKVKVIHTLPDGTREEVVVKVRDIMNKHAGDKDNVTLRSGDVVIVPESLL
ncbi:MAG TPA: polysaccharide biosynthesis/export family protein [Candidatus Omnitrophota bacterium]|nr:polysaccharide biosynthesis/export family protein [Candidatus Omnitrophota bacterium]HPS37660.1 polysaccharide biosynthesis/export family protein [Candidatus Omnitrophota bacterium]